MFLISRCDTIEFCRLKQSKGAAIFEYLLLTGSCCFRMGKIFFQQYTVVSDKADM